MQQEEDPATEAEVDPEHSALGDKQQRFWAEFLKMLKLDDPEQPLPPPRRRGWFSLSLAAPGDSCWLMVYRNSATNKVGLFVTGYRDGPGDYVMHAILDDWETIKSELGGSASIETIKDGRRQIVESNRFGSLEDDDTRKRAFIWLADRVNTFINVMRPRVRSAGADYLARGS